MLKTLFLGFWGLKRWIKSVLIILTANIVIFTAKSYLLGLKGYYMLQLGISVILLVFFVLFYLIERKESSIYKKFALSHGTFFKKLNPNLSAFCFHQSKRLWTWLFTGFCFLHLTAISIITLLTWNCTTYVRVTAAAAFIGLIIGLISLKMQAKAQQIEAQNKATHENYLQKEPVHIPAIQREQHPYHIVPNSIWPIVTALFVFDILVFTVKYFHFGFTQYIKHHVIASAIVLIVVIACWFWNMVQEAAEGHHTKNVRWNLLHGFMLFIASEVMLFFAIFWAFFHSSLSPSVAIYCMWPPLGIETIDAFGLPFLNTVLLISSGLTLTVSHRALAGDVADFQLTSSALVQTLVLGALFTLVQGFEYTHAPFAINDGIYGSVFYFATGFHGLHVIIGSILLLVSLIRNALRHLHPKQHVGFLCSIWYWHFVDVVWIFLFLTIYWWGS